MWRSTALLAALASATALGPAFAAGLEITVAGEANGVITIDLLEDVAPLHVERITSLAAQGAYDGVVFHRVIPRFMAQTGDVQFGDITDPDYSYRRAGSGDSGLPDLPAEFSDISYDPGVVGMARLSEPDTANSQFFITLAPATHLDELYTVVGIVTSGQEVVAAIKQGTRANNGAIRGEPDRMVSVTVIE